MKLRHVISARQFLDKPLLDELFQSADEMKSTMNDSLHGKILATLFYEPSTRTRFSFEAAMHRLGGSVIATENASQFSSAAKGETLEDTIRVISGYADAIVLRHYQRGSAEIAAKISDVPIINAGDGDGEHPTQALLDLYTIKKELGGADGLKIAMVGDLLYGRTVHSLVNLLALYDGIKIYLISPAELRIPERYRNHLTENRIDFDELEDMDSVLGDADIVYVTRIQKERFESEKKYNILKNSYVIDRHMLEYLKEDAIIMHPLPRVGEISPEVDCDRRAAYFRQAKNGLHIRMALLQAVLC
ncbi:MAG: aspartate carbamoyltransferase [Candidatus Aenigmarchaeota archaeon]|nr:aspartate carbamoyltransferase [Candidatus Aenigmarchaeota archaeon]MDI6722379.1 aspartate carbamoyltransferase [Candidatus Aenigmarchaeota archaeon]